MSTRQLTELLSCENIYGELASPYSLNADILSAIKNLYLRELAITYNSKSGKERIIQISEDYGTDPKIIKKLKLKI